MASSRNSLRPDPGERVAAAVDDVLMRQVRGGQHIVAAVSGGIDSVVLLHLLHRLLPSHGAALSAFHVHHGLSPNADAWENFCAELCRHWQIPFACRRVAVDRNGGIGIEAAARNARHAAYAALEADWVALAHHRGDQAETLVFNLLRGCGVQGAGAMREVRDGRLLRPLLRTSRDDIAAYARDHDLTWVEDESNADAGFSRNFLRHEILPRLASRFPGAEAGLAAAAAHFAEACRLLDDLARLDLGTNAPRFPVSLALLAGLSEARARNVLRFLLAAEGVGIPSEDRLVEALRQFLTAGPDRHPRTRFGPYELSRRRGQIHLTATSAAGPALPPT
jgi:tRNA(Ile)-lysidine synthase